MTARTICLKATVLAALALTAAMATAGEAMAAAPAVSANDADLRCLVVSFALASLPENKSKQAASISAFYFLGRLEGRAPGTDWPQKAMDRLAVIKGEQLRADAPVCEKVVAAQGQMLQQKGQAMAARQKAARPAPKP